MAAYTDSPTHVDLAGYLRKKGNMRWQKRWFVLSGNTLRYYKDQNESHCRGEFAFATWARISNKSLGFQLIMKGGNQALKLEAETPEEWDQWRIALLNAIKADGSRQEGTKQVTISNETFEVSMKYTLKRKIGGGAYGVVVSAVDETDVKNVAIKKIKGAFDDPIDAKRILREIRLMRMFNHPKVIDLHDMLTPPSLDYFNDVYIVTGLMSTDLQSIIFSKTPLNEDQHQWIMYQCLCGLNYMHSAGVLHRDLKPQNILVDTNTCDVRLCDFGLSRGELPAEGHDAMDPNHADPAVTEEGESGEMTLYVVTRWYRAPEVLLNNNHYDFAIDLWSMGCILGELIGRRHLLQGRGTMDQLKKICKFLGKPKEADLWFVTDEKARAFMRALPHSEPEDMHDRFPDASDIAIDLIFQMLQINPRRRISCRQSLEHPWLQPVRERQFETVAQRKVDISDVEALKDNARNPALKLNKQNLQRKMYEEIALFHRAQDPRQAAQA